MKVFELLFELASSDRLKIMSLVEKQELKLSHISKKLDMTVTEASRHLQRLSEAKLLEKDAEGRYELTPFGQLTLSLMPSFDFISKYRDYFAAHTLSRLPHEFIGRMGDLANCAFTEDIMVAFHSVECLIVEAKEYVWILSNQVLMSTLPLLDQAVKRGVKFQLIMPEDLIPPPGFIHLPHHISMDQSKLVERRMLSRVDLIIAMSEKTARLSFPASDGKMDYVGFGSTDERGHKWCQDLFMHYWEEARRA